jgi:hypothetical protein
VLGRWWSEGTGFVFRLVGERLEAVVDGAARISEPSVFESDGPDRYRTVSGRERGELLVVLRDDSGAVSELRWATYAFTRQPQAFGD